MIFHIAVCSPDSVLRSRVERQCLDYYARRDDACIIEQLDSPEALLTRDDAGAVIHMHWATYRFTRTQSAFDGVSPSDG